MFSGAFFDLSNSSTNFTASTSEVIRLAISCVVKEYNSSRETISNLATRSRAETFDLQSLSKVFDEFKNFFSALRIFTI